MLKLNWRFAILLVATGAVLSACGPEDAAAVDQAALGAPAQDPQNPQNSVPVISGTPATAVVAGTTYLLQLQATDFDGDAMTFSASGLPAWAVIDPQSGRLYGTPAETDVGTTADITLSVSDGKASSALPAFQIVIGSVAPPAPAPSPPPGNLAPVISGSPATTVQATTDYVFAPAASDPESRTLTYSVANKPSWAAFSTASGRLSGTPAANQTGAFRNIVISVSDGSLTTALPQFSITVTASPNRAPTISGAPATSVAAGSSYTFTPTATDADGNTLAFTITGKPAWAVFSVATGSLTGTALAGTYANIVISVSDGSVSRALPAFTLTVSAGNAGTASLNWATPTQNTDGSVLSDLAGYRVYHGMSATALNEIIQRPGATNTSYAFTQLASGMHYFAVAAYNNAGVESSMSVVGSKLIP